MRTSHRLAGIVVGRSECHTRHRFSIDMARKPKTCRASLLAAGGWVIAERTHRIGDRSAWRHFGLVCAHPHPASGDATTLRNAAGLPLPSELTGEPAAAGLIGKEEQAERECSAPTSGS